MPETVLFCPGIGANGDMFLPIIEKLRRISVTVEPKFLDFPDPMSRNETIESFTKRAFSAPGIRNQKFDMVVGCSFGGMLLQEAICQKLIPETRTVLICTAFSGADINPLLHAMIPATYLIPGIMYRPLQLFIALIYPLFRFRRVWARKFSRMFRETNPAVFFIAPRMIRNWRKHNFHEQVVLPGNTIQFHGSSDPLISFKKIIKKRIIEFPLYKKNHIIFATEVDFIAGEIKNSLLRKIK